MIFDIKDIISKNKYSEDKAAYLNDFKVIDVLYRKSTELLIIKAENRCVLPFSLYEDIISYFNELGFNNTKLYIKALDQELSIKDINLYMDEYRNKNRYFKNCVPVISIDGFSLSYTDRQEHDTDEEELDDLKLFFYDLGYRKDISLIYKDISKVEVVEKEALPVSEAPKNNSTNNEYKNYSENKDKPSYRSKKTYKEIVIDDMIDTMYNVSFEGEIFKVDERETRTNILIETVYVKDENNAAIVKIVEGKRFGRDFMKGIKEGKTCRFSGNYRFDNFANDYIFECDSIDFIEAEKSIYDDEEEKRVELHAHTKLSEMDGVCSPAEIVNAAFTMGHRGVAITDHLCLQGYHEAYGAYKGIMKANKENKPDFKLLYGCELNMVYPHLNIVYNSTDDLLSEAEYVVFDLETTGLSTRYDHIIEFGAALMYKGSIIEERDYFIKPPVALSETTKALTHISDENVNTAKTFAQLKDELLEFMKGRVLVAHNASFDYGFLNAELERIGEKPLDNIVVDTLDLSRSMFKTRRAFRLGNICRQYGVAYDEEVAHRANYDASVLASAFNLMMKDLAKSNVKTFNELKAFQGEDAFVKNRAFHTTVLCKNHDGLIDLFKLISISNTDTLAVFGKANTKDANSDFIAEPRIFKDTLDKYRKNLLVGTACLNGEVFEIASTRSKEELAEVISFYDYVEVQPLENYRHLYEDRELFTKDRLEQYLRDIIDEALRQNKIVVATGDVHYVRKDQKILRDVYISAQGIGGAHHPLFIYDKEKRLKQVTPDQRFLNTREMLEAFKWLNDEKLARELVIENPNKILDMCENVKPFSDELMPPKINDAIGTARKCNIIEEPFTDRHDVIDADQYLKEFVYYNAHKLYGENLPEIIEKRIDVELNSIIGNGYGVIYFVCHLMVKRSNDDGYVVGSRGSVGSSLVATFSDITEVNPLAPHYICPKCHHIEWVDNVASGYDLKEKDCPECGCRMRGEGQNIPFETFLGFHGDKIPDIDLNFSGDYQPKAHLFTREIFGPENVFRAGTISTVAEKTAFGYVSGYCEEKDITNMSKAQRQRLASGCEGVKRTTGQHAGGIVVLPDDMKIEDVTPIQYPANDKDAAWRSTHFEYHDYSDNLLKFDILGHVDPTAMRLFQNVSGIDVKTIPMNDEKVLSLFYSTDALGIVNPNYHEETGACGLPEFGTLNTRNTIEETRPHVFSDLVQISGLSHGTDVWRGNAQELIHQGIPLSNVIGCRDDIMSTLISYNLESSHAFSIMEHVRKGKGLTPEEEGEMLENKVPQWYIDSCKKIKYMFPKAHAVAYCIMAVRVAWFKVYYPEYYYVSYFTLRCDAYELETMMKDADSIYARVKEIQSKMNSRENPASKKERDIHDCLEVCYEMASRGYRIINIDLYRSLATQFRVNPDNNHEIIPPFAVLDGLGGNVAESIVEARKNGEFLSKEDLMDRTQLSQTLVKKLNDLGVLKGMEESNQISLF
ncbi:MAG: PolC-type DNA polymerase III [Erysipelotrichaceae bacterium]|nr:PolC-type DNA polymerase III [Erysipelotrichaceae bacterium]